MQSTRTADAVVIGGGAVGSAISLELAQRGIIPHLIERDAIAYNASGYAWGGLSAHFGSGVPGPMTEIYRDAIAKHIALYERYGEDAAHDWQLEKVISLKLADNTGDAEEIAADVAWMKSENFDAEMIEPEVLYRLEPAIRAGMIAASIADFAWELDSMSYTKSLAAEAVRSGVEVVIGEVAALEERGGRVAGVRMADQTRIDTPVVIVATGPWTGEIAGIPALPITPTKGEILRLKRDGDDLKHRVGFGGFNVGRKPDGTVWAGTYEWERGFDRDVTDEGYQYIFNGVTGYVPSLSGSELQTATACLRPVSSDGMPIVGESPATKGLFFANGAGKKGILLSPIFAEWISNLVVDSSEPPGFVSPSRFLSD